MKLSIVTTLFNSEDYIKDFHKRASAVAQKLVGDDFEIIFVNDGSPDRSLELAVKLTTSHQNVTVIDLSRNFGHHKAMMTGLKHAKGDYIFLIDSDLEEEPEWLEGFYKQLNLSKCDVVYGVQKSRKGNLVDKLCGACFYKLFNLISGFNLQENLVTARLMSQRYVSSLVKHEEREILIAGLWHITGFEQECQLITKLNTSKTSYTFGHKISIIINSITSFSNVPLIIIFYIGLFVTTIAFFYILFIVVNWIYLSEPLDGWSSLMASVWTLGGLIISFIGIIGIYLSKVFSETKRRPYTIIRKIYHRQEIH